MSGASGGEVPGPAGGHRPLAVNRRTLLRTAASATATAALGAATTAAITAATGCSGRHSTIRVVVVWSGGELAQFRTVVRGYERERGHAVEVVSAGDGIDSFLRARERTGNLPDVAVLPRPGLIAEYARRGWLEPVPAPVVDRFPLAWNELLTVDGEIYGAWFKAAHKSLFWYLDGTLDETPETWDGLVELVSRRASAGGIAPLAIGAADGWVLTDWLENLLAALDPDRRAYESLLGRGADWRGELVRQALSRLGALWRIRGAVPDGPRRALLTQFGESVLDVVARERALMVFEGDFVAAFAQGYPRAHRLRFFRFPKVTVDGPQPLLIGGDAAVVFRASRAGAELVEWLTDGAKPVRQWISGGGYLSPNTAIDASEYPERARRLAEELRDERAEPRFDLSDRLPGGLTGADGVGIWLILQDFYAAVSGGRMELPEATERASGQLAAAARLAWQEAGR